MAGVKGRSGPPGNLNNCRKPWRAFWRRRALKEGDRWILPILENYAAGLASDKPGLSEAESRLIEIAQIARGGSMLILAEAARSGFTKPERGSWNVSPGAKELGKFLSVERACLQTLGLGRRTKQVVSPLDLLRQQSSGAPSLPSSPQPIASPRLNATGEALPTETILEVNRAAS